MGTLAWLDFHSDPIKEIYFDIELDENGKFKKEAAQYVRRR